MYVYQSHENKVKTDVWIATNITQRHISGNKQSFNIYMVIYIYISLPWLKKDNLNNTEKVLLIVIVLKIHEIFVTGH